MEKTTSDGIFLSSQVNGAEWYHHMHGRLSAGDEKV